MNILFKKCPLLLHLFFLIISFDCLAYSTDQAIPNDVQFFISTLEKMKNSKKPAYFSYKPWEEPFLLINKSDLTRFVGINLTCNSGLEECGPVSGTSISAIRGKLLTPFNVPGMGLFHLSICGTPNIDNGVVQFCNDIDKGTLLFVSVYPLPIGPLGSVQFSRKLMKDPDFILTQFLIHESFHVFTQMYDVFSKFLPFVKSRGWKTDISNAFIRQYGRFCDNPDTDRFRQETKILRKIFHLLLKEKPIEKIEPYARKFIQLRQDLYDTSPVLPNLPQGKENSTCRTYHNYMEREEGITEFATTMILLETGIVTPKKMKWFFNNLYWNNLDFENNLTSSKYFSYASGAIQSLLLDRLEPNKEWRIIAQEKPDFMLFDRLKEALGI